jgi:hypothetical protein
MQDTVIGQLLKIAGSRLSFGNIFVYQVLNTAIWLLKNDLQRLPANSLYP